VLLATVATIIASQAVISGVYSITRQAVQLGQLPRMEIRHTSAIDYGQIYVPRINAVPLRRRRSDRADLPQLRRACLGLRHRGHRRDGHQHLPRRHRRGAPMGLGLRWAHPVFGFLAFIDLVPRLQFAQDRAGRLAAARHRRRRLHGDGHLAQGRRAHIEKIRSESLPLDLFLERADKTPVRVAGTAVFLTARSDAVPGALLHNLKHNKVLHERVVLAMSKSTTRPIVSAPNASK
jgi:KUP system potassium uptake protein